MEARRFETTHRALQNGIKVYESALQGKAEDRTVVLEFEHGTMIAIFDGHCGREAAEFASKNLPQLVAAQFNPAAIDVDQVRVMTQIFEDFDRSLLSKQFRDGRPAVEKKNIWVISLGDCDAVCGRMQNGKMTPILLSDRHNGSNPKEVERLLSQHPGEVDVIPYGAVVGVLRVTRALGDHQLKVQSRALAERILAHFSPSIVASSTFGIWDRNRNLTPPYISSTPVVARYDLLPGDILVFASDGLPDALWPIPDEETWEVIMALVGGKDDERLDHRRIQPSLEDNPAELLVKNVLFGADTTKMANQLVNPALDDISVVIVDLGWKEIYEDLSLHL
ncbi:phosphatase 2C-like domain-containing protein [Mycena metata]|uniref:Phosphatase 2C-like domain-containing protein n=1 Tax=Mycena metata TaxID=1033252 RepID=A0AAD7NCN7_9AGAR|nr:phosphatase 2C-like domain-containing protein [Mycena metata]